MAKAKRGTRRTVTPRIVQSSHGTSHAVFILLVLAAFAAALVWAFSAGRQAGTGMPKSPHKSIAATEGECDALARQVADLKQQSIALEQSRQIDRVATRNLSKQLQEAQDERLALEKEVAFLRRLIQEGGSGILQPQDFKVEATGEPGEFRYNFTVRQLIRDFGESVGEVEIQVIGWRDGKAMVLSLDKLAGSDPVKHKLKFKQFQNFQGSIKVPDDFRPEELVVEIRPKTAGLVPTSETFPWNSE